MDYFHQTNKKTPILWSLLLCLVLLSVQGQEVKLHAHDLDYNSNHYVVGYHQVSFTHDMFDDHHDNVVAEIDISPDGLFKSINNSTYSFVLFALFFTLVTLVFLGQQLVQGGRKRRLSFSRLNTLSPPLRAPPQH